MTISSTEFLRALGLFIFTSAMSAAAFAAEDAPGDNPYVRSAWERASLAEWYTPRTDFFYLDDEQEVELISMLEPRDVRICNNARRGDMPIALRYDGSEATVRSGNCIIVEAKNVKVSPAEELPEYVELVGSVSID